MKLPFPPRCLFVSAFGFVFLQSDANAQFVRNPDFDHFLDSPRQGSNGAPRFWNYGIGHADLNAASNGSGNPGPIFSDHPLGSGLWRWADFDPNNDPDPVVSSFDGGNWINIASYRGPGLPG